MTTQVSIATDRSVIDCSRRRSSRSRHQSCQALLPTQDKRFHFATEKNQLKLVRIVVNHKKMTKLKSQNFHYGIKETSS